MSLARRYVLVGVGAVLMLVLGLLWVNQAPYSPARRLLRAIDGNSAGFLRARKEFLMNSTADASGVLLEYAANVRRPASARQRALAVLRDMAIRQPLPGCGAALARLLDGQSPGFKAEVLLTMAALRSFDGAAALVPLITGRTDSVISRGATLALVAAVGAMADSVARYARLGDSLSIDSCVRLLAPMPVGKGVVYPVAARFYQRAGDSARAAAMLRDVGCVDRWWVCGPFPSKRLDGVSRVDPPQVRAFNPRDTFVVDAEITARWSPLRGVTPADVIDIRRLFVRELDASAFFCVDVVAPSAREALLLCGSDDGIRVWLNDADIWSFRGYRGTVADNDAIRVTLNAGRNRLLVKVVQDMGAWGMQCRIADLRGVAMPDVQYELGSGE